MRGGGLGGGLGVGLFLFLMFCIIFGFDPVTSYGKNRGNGGG